ncbi:MAG: GTP cyclohydrolase II, partial [Pseudomonadota bacterium]
MTDALSPTLSELYARARNDLRMGVPVVLGGALVAAVETLTPARLSAMQAAGAVLVVTNWRA